MRRLVVRSLALLALSVPVGCRLGGDGPIKDVYTPIVLLDTGAPAPPDAAEAPDVPDSELPEAADAAPPAEDTVELDVTPPCDAADPAGCWAESLVDGGCEVVDQPDGTPCGDADGRCLAGACDWTPTCPPGAVRRGATAGDFHEQCQDNVGCATLCTPDTCGCWLCDGPFCVVSGCDSSSPPPQTDAAVVLDPALLGGPQGAVPADPMPTVAASASPGWSGAGDTYPILLLHLYQAPPPEAAWWTNGGATQSVPLDQVAVVATRLLVGSVVTQEIPCSGGEVTHVPSPTLAVLAPSSGDASTVEFQLEAAAEGVTLVTLVRVLQDQTGQRAYEVIQLGGFEAPFSGPSEEPQTLEATAWRPVPVAHAGAFAGLWAEVDWAAAVEETL